MLLTGLCTDPYAAKVKAVARICGTITLISLRLHLCVVDMSFHYWAIRRKYAPRERVHSSSGRGAASHVIILHDAAPKDLCELKSSGSLMILFIFHVNAHLLV
jgi:hypothetical protein